MQEAPAPKKRGIARILLLWTLGFILLFIGSSLLSVLAFKFLPPPTSSFMVQKQFSRADKKAKPRIHYHWISWKSIPSSLPLAVVAAEDQKFPQHNGFDLEGIAEARERNKQGGRLRGGSTISQQTAKNLFLWPSKSYLRKGLEVWFTALIETLWSKKRILEVYLNIAEFGDGIYGVDAAAEHLLKKRATDLTRTDAATLAAVLPSPKRLHADRPSAYVQERISAILDQMELLGNGYLAQIAQ
ncbi:MAG: monofunctional biosynthetic peptidoglycan transglycosylase [Calditrichaeota bacterium]|nr:MAG: monofunctional biosynthetic peptidoglycan transglycosylase [Calditrichota bacterium]